MLDRSSKFDAEKMAFNLRAKASMREFLRSKTWEEKVESIERMNEAGKIARAAMKEAMAKQATSSTTNHS
jgi:hypothetical protein